MLLNHYYDGLIEAGCDEAGRGCLAGSVYAAAVILPDGYENEMLNDSKQLTEKKRYLLTCCARSLNAMRWRGLWASSPQKRLTKSISSTPRYSPCIGPWTS